MEFLGKAIRKEKEITGIQIRKEVQSSMFANDMILYLENNKNSINTPGKVAESKINTQKNQ
jgi:hypothetical protein